MKKKSIEKKGGLLKYNYNILKQDKKFLFFLFAGFFILYSFLDGLWKIPLINFGINRTLAVGIWDYLFIFGASALLSLFIGLWRYERKGHIQSNKIVGVFGGGMTGVLAGICPACQSIGLVAFGATFLNIPTTFLTPYLDIVKILSIGLLILAVYIKADSVYTKTCKTCPAFPKQFGGKKVRIK